MEPANQILLKPKKDTTITPKKPDANQPTLSRLPIVEKKE